VGQDGRGGYLMAGWWKAEDFQRWIDEINTGERPVEPLAVQPIMELLEGAKSVVDRVDAIHQPVDAMNYHGGTPRRAQVCSGCGTDDGNWQQYPCPTIRALEGRR
jgi:hypothetical protein